MESVARAQQSMHLTVSLLQNANNVLYLEPMSPHNTIMHVVMETLNVSDQMYAVDCKCRSVTARCFKLCMLSVCDACCDIMCVMPVVTSCVACV